MKTFLTHNALGFAAAGFTFAIAQAFGFGVFGTAIITTIVFNLAP